MVADSFGPPTTDIFPGTPPLRDPGEGFPPLERHVDPPLEEVTAEVTVKQPTKQPTPKMTAVGLSGGFGAALVAWLRARFDLDITVEDVTLFGPILVFAAGWFMKDRAPVWMRDQVTQWLR